MEWGQKAENNPSKANNMPCDLVVRECGIFHITERRIEAMGAMVSEDGEQR